MIYAIQVIDRFVVSLEHKYFFLSSFWGIFPVGWHHQCKQIHISHFSNYIKTQIHNLWISECHVCSWNAEEKVRMKTPEKPLGNFSFLLCIFKLCKRRAEPKCQQCPKLFQFSTALPGSEGWVVTAVYWMSSHSKHISQT